ncbi:MAG: trigger factor [Proteobacteria bacterium]|nr:trigger factor [Pseudomonadota bacterium]
MLSALCRRHGMQDPEDINYRGEWMQVSLETTGNLERRITVEVPGEKIQTAVEKKLQDMTRSVKLPGFRPGKVPLGVVRQRFGKQVRQEVLADTMQSSYREAIHQEKLRPVGTPRIERLGPEASQDLKYAATFEVYPEIELADVSGFEIETAQAEVTDEDVDSMLEKLRGQKMRWRAVDRAAEKDNRVSIDFKGTLDGEAFPGGSQDDFAVVLGSQTLLPEFEQQLEGVKKGDTRQIEVGFPEDYRQPELAGKQAVFDVQVKKVETGSLPALDKHFVRELGIEDGKVETLNVQLRRNLEAELEQCKRTFDKNQVMQKLFESNQFELPAALLEQEVRSVFAQAMNNLNLEDESKLPKAQLEEQAKRRLSLGLIIGEIVRQNKIQLDSGRVNQQIDAIASGYDKPEDVVQYYRNSIEARAGIESQVMEEQVVDWVLEQAQRSTRSFTFDEMVNNQF